MSSTYLKSLQTRRWVLFIIAFVMPVLKSVGQNVPVSSETVPTGPAIEINVPDPVPVLGGSGYNFFRTYKPYYKTPLADGLNPNSDPNAVAVTTTFKDGFNRPIEEINRHYTLNNKGFMVFPYDSRIVPGGSYSFLPYARNFDNSLSSDGSSFYDPNTMTHHKDYYAGLYPGEGYTAYSSTQNFSDAVSRGAKVYSPGKSQIGQGRSTTFTKIANDASTIRSWKTGVNGEPVSDGFYGANELFGVSHVNSEGRSSIVFSDKDGREIYKKTLIKTNPSTYAETYYVYDEMGRLRYALLPKAIAAIGSGNTVSSDILQDLCYSFNYDNLSRLSYVHNPGQKENVYLVYDRFQRVVMRQDPKEKMEGKWEVSFYDKLGRLIATSLYLNNNDVNYWQGQMDAPPSNPLSSSLEYYLTTDAGEGVYPMENAIPNNTMMAYYFFDYYKNTLDFNGSIYNQLVSEQNFTVDILNTIESDYPARSNRVFNQLTGEKIRIIKSDNASSQVGDWRYNTFYYDDKGRVIASAVFDKLNSDGQMDFQRAQYVSNQYDFSGRNIMVKHTVINKSALDASKKHVEIVKNEFEPGTGLLKTIRHKVDGSEWSPISQYTYDELSRPKRHVHGNYGEVQDMDYNIRGQLTGINAIYAETGNKQGESRSFGQSLKYDFGFSKPRFDGKISGSVWRGSGGNNTNPLAYGYSYDAGGRLTQADFREKNGSVWSNANLDYTVSNLDYDIAGNIISMKQRGMVFENGALATKDIDKLKYTYEVNSHRLSNVLDTIISDYKLGDFVDNNTTGPDYEYDVNGNITKDLNKKIQSISYNMLNKPAVINMKNGDRVEISYDSKGSKLEEIVAKSDGGKRTNYVGNFVFKNDSLQYLITDEGRTVYNPSDTSMKEEYFVKDYLGNIRSIVDVYSYPILQYLTSFEMASANLDGMLFSNIAEVRETKPGSTNPGDVKAGRLNGEDPSRRIGAAVLLKVMAGDRIEMNVNNFYDNFDQNSNSPVPVEEMLSNVISTLTNGAGGFVGSESHNVRIVDQLFTEHNYIQGFEQLVQQNLDPSKPNSHLKYLMFNDKMELIPEMSGAFQADGNGTWSTIGTTSPIEIVRNGFIAVYLDNRMAMDVYYDLVNIRFTRGNLKEETHYYPYGLPMASMGSSANGLMAHKHRYQGNENNTDLDLNIMDFNFRQYDVQLGRFMSVDPLGNLTDALSPYAAMNNNPVSFIDPLGLTGESSENSWVLDEVVIYADGTSKVNPNPGGGNAILAPFWPSAPSGPPNGRWGKGASGHNTDGYSSSSGGSSGGTPDGNTTEVGHNTPGSPNGTKDGVPGGTGKGGDVASGKEGPNTNSTGDNNGIDGIGTKGGSANGSVAMTMAATAVLSWIKLDEATPDATDALPLKHIAYGTFATGMYIGFLFNKFDLAGKMAKEIDRILSKVRPGKGVVYMLTVNVPGMYRTVRGDMKWLEAGDIWKYGQTGFMGERYTPETLRTMIPGGVTAHEIYEGTTTQILVYEKYMIYGYFYNHSTLPPGNRIFR